MLARTTGESPCEQHGGSPGSLGEAFFIPDGIFAVHAPDSSITSLCAPGCTTALTRSAFRANGKRTVPSEKGISATWPGYQRTASLCLFEHENALRRGWLRDDAAFTEKMRRQFALST